MGGGWKVKKKVFIILGVAAAVYIRHFVNVSGVYREIFVRGAFYTFLS